MNSNSLKFSKDLEIEKVLIMDKPKIIVQMYVLQLKTLMKNPSMVFVMFFIPLIILIGLGILLATASTFVAGFGLPLILIVGIMFGYLYYSSNNTTIGLNNKLTRISEPMVNISILL